MGKKKAANTENKVKSLEDAIMEKFGEGVLVSGTYVTENPSRVIPVSPQMDIMLNGGIPFGSFVIPTGAPKIGKTSMSLDLAATALNIPTEFEEPRRLYYFKVEGRLQERDFIGIHHLIPHRKDNVIVMQSARGKILNAEDYLDAAEQLINEKPGSIFIMDSMSQLCSKSRREKDWHDGKAFRDDVPTLLSNFCKRIAQVIPINQSLFIGITHQISNTGLGFSPWAEASGNKVQYQVDVKLKAKYNKVWKIRPEDKSRTGIQVFWECWAAPLQNGPAIEEATTKFRFGWGIDKHSELLDICTDLGIIKKGGAWYTITDEEGNENKLQGEHNARDFLVQNPQVSLNLYRQFREAMDLCPIPEEYISVCL